MSKALIKLQTIYSRGVNFFGQLGLNNGYRSSEDFTPIPSLEKVECNSIYASYAQSLCLLENNDLLIWGWPLDVRSQMQITLLLQTNPSLAKFIQRYLPVPWIGMREGKDYPQKESSGVSNYEDLSIGGGFIIACDKDGRAYAWGDNHRGQCGSNSYDYKLRPYMLEDLLDKSIVKVAAGYQHGLFLTIDGEVYGTGRAGNFAFGPVGQGTLTVKSCIIRPQKARIQGIVDIAAGQNHSLFLNEEGKVYAVGKNEYGQCGQASSRPIEKPQDLFLPEKASMIACGTKHSIVLGESGSIYTFGSNQHGQINGSRNANENQSSPLPVDLPFSSKVVRIYAEFDKNAVFLENGEVWVWGGQDFRFIGGEYYESMTLINPLLPKPFEEDIIDIALGYMHTMIMTST